MKITKRIQIGDYSFELTLESKSVHAHSLMTDYVMPMNILEAKLYEWLHETIKQHKEDKKL